MWEMRNEKWGTRSWNEEMGNKKYVESDPEKWEMRLKREFS